MKNEESKTDQKEMCNGVVTFWNFEKGYGFISTDDLPEPADCFLHVKEVKGMLQPYEGARVQFKWTKETKGYKATYAEIIPSEEGENDESD